MHRLDNAIPGLFQFDQVLESDCCNGFRFYERSGIPQHGPPRKRSLLCKFKKAVLLTTQTILFHLPASITLSLLLTATYLV
jgi:hypothetical protein